MWNTARDGSGQNVVPGNGDTLDFSNLANKTSVYFTNTNGLESVKFKCMANTGWDRGVNAVAVFLDKGVFRLEDQTAQEFRYVRINPAAILKADRFRATQSYDENIYECFAFRNDGVMDVGDLRFEFGYPNQAHHMMQFFRYASSGHLLRVNSITHNASCAVAYGPAMYLVNGSSAECKTLRIVMGSGGFRFEDCHRHYACRPYFHVPENATVTVFSSADYAIAENPYRSDHFAFNINSASSEVVFDTSDYDERESGRDVPRTITAAGGLRGGGKVKVVGCGTLAFVTAYSDFRGGLAVHESATVAVDAGCIPGTGAVALNDASTLKVAQSGTVALAGALKMADGAVLAFNFTDKAVAPMLKLASGTTAPATVNVRLSCDKGATPPAGGEYQLTSGYDFTGKSINVENRPPWAASVLVDKSGNLVMRAKVPALKLYIR